MAIWQTMRVPSRSEHYIAGEDRSRFVRFWSRL